MSASPPLKPLNPLRLTALVILLLLRLTADAAAQTPTLNLPDLGSAAGAQQHAKKLQRLG